MAYLEVDANQGTWWALGPTISRGSVGACTPENGVHCSEVLSGVGVLAGITRLTPPSKKKTTGIIDNDIDSSIDSLEIGILMQYPN